MRNPAPRPHNSQELLDTLRGGLASTHWPSVAASRKSLHVRIHKLRSRGYVIESYPMPVPVQFRRGKPPVLYVLREDEPRLGEADPVKLKVLEMVRSEVPHRKECQLKPALGTARPQQCSCDHNARAAVAFSEALAGARKV